MADQCKGLTGWLFGHDYQIAVDGRKLYFGHVCRRCGHKIIKEL